MLALVLAAPIAAVPLVMLVVTLRDRLRRARVRRLYAQPRSHP